MKNETIYLGNAVYASFNQGMLFVRDTHNVIILEDDMVTNLVNYIQLNDQRTHEQKQGIQSSYHDEKAGLG